MKQEILARFTGFAAVDKVTSKKEREGGHGVFAKETRRVELDDDDGGRRRRGRGGRGAVRGCRRGRGRSSKG